MKDLHNFLAGTGTMWHQHIEQSILANSNSNKSKKKVGFSG